jgi:hypothetical protein
MINLFIDKENLLNNSEHINKLKNLREIINSNSSLLSKEKIKLDKSLKLSIELVKLIECLGQNNNKILSSNNNKIENKSQIDEAMAQSLERFGDMKVKKSNKIPSNKSKRKIGINNDDNPKVISKYPNNKVEFVQELAIRYLKPITPEPSGNIIINQLPDESMIF